MSLDSGEMCLGRMLQVVLGVLLRLGPAGIGRFMQARSAMTLDLGLPESSFVNGAIIPVDGGMSIRHV